VLFDVSDSMITKDDIPDEKTPYDKLPTRQDKVLTFLNNKDKDGLDFFGKLTQGPERLRNPVVALRFGNKLDEQTSFIHTKGGGSWLRAHYEEEQSKFKEARARNPKVVFTKQTLPADFLELWLKAPGEVKDEDLQTRADTWELAQREKWKKLYKEVADANKTRRDEGLFAGTNLGATRTALDRELNNLVSGIVVFTDGRMNQGSDFYDDLTREANKRQVPIFVVGVGEVRPQIKIGAPTIRAPQQIQPDDRFRVLVDVKGEGLAEQEFDLTLEVSAIKKPENDAKAAVVPQDLAIIESEDPKNPKKVREPIVLVEAGQKITLKPENRPKFDRSTPPRAEVEFLIDALTLARAAGKEGSVDPKKRWEIVELKGGALRFEAKVPKNAQEIFEDKPHVSEPADIRVLKRELRVLLMASAAMRDYQFVRTLLVREMDMKRADLVLYLQLPPNASEPRKGVVQDVKPERLLRRFPDRYEETPADAGEVERFQDLANYDVLIAFDPDWNQLDAKQIQNIKTWVDKGGGLIVVGGPINTVQLAAPGTNKPVEKFAPLAEIYPVKLDDVRLREGERSTAEAWPLLFGEDAKPDMEFLHLAEEGDKDYNPTFLADWDQLWGKDKPGKGKVERGFYNFYPVDSVKTGALVIGRFTDPDPKARMRNNELQPYIVLTPPASGRRVVWIGSAETWRIRAFRESWHERFWIKLARYAGAQNQGKINRRITPFVEESYTTGRMVAMDFKIDGIGGKALTKPRGERSTPRIRLTVPKGVNEKEIKTEHPLIFKADGMFGVQFPVKSSGTYAYKLTVPQENGSEDTLEGKFEVKESNPELDNVRPDYDAMMRLASDADPVLARLSDSDRQVMEQILQSRQRGVGAGEEKLKLLYDLRTADKIPICMLGKFDLTRNRGAVTDLWDIGFKMEGVALWVFGLVGATAVLLGGLFFILWMAAPKYSAEALAGLTVMAIIAFFALGSLLFGVAMNAIGWGPVKVTWVLLGVVTLLSLEWMTRKLLRLA
jgi:hypothetical protein